MGSERAPEIVPISAANKPAQVDIVGDRIRVASLEIVDRALAGYLESRSPEERPETVELEEDSKVIALLRAAKDPLEIEIEPSSEADTDTVVLLISTDPELLENNKESPSVEIRPEEDLMEISDSPDKFIVVELAMSKDLPVMLTEPPCWVLEPAEILMSPDEPVEASPVAKFIRPSVFREIDPLTPK